MEGSGVDARTGLDMLAGGLAAARAQGYGSLDHSALLKVAEALWIGVA